MTADPVFVIHGVGNRDPEGFAATVAVLEAATGLEMVPVYWGDLGADDRFVDLAIPPQVPSGPAPDGSGLRDGSASAAPNAAPDARALFAGASSVRHDGLALVREALRRELDAADEERDTLRGGGTKGPELDEVLDALEDAWPQTRWLSITDDPGLLREAGDALARSVLEAVPGEDADQDRYGLRESPGRSRGLAPVVRRRLVELDRVAGAAIQAVAGRFNQAVRTRFGAGISRFLGDVLVYQRHRAAIHARVRDAVDAIDPALGRTADRPVRVVAHSLGGVIAVDLATAATPLWTRSLLTFGSQSAYFHLCDPRGGQLLPHRGTDPVALPPSLGRWTNLWEPMDVLAFVAAGVFRLHDGTTPLDVPINHTASAGLWTHSAYWDLPEVAAAIGAAMRA
ncbi:hypothetical protein P3T37_000131 [Kitasatospora sp. MAA4]|uniref:hypothetical protein n=1 Tax=Kitasatospora sp. MAA4 TaxID=3035093 RepID=UPI00247702A3|nr:hypothetical protein [Kitasatospora sp. MAA4]MDH6130764.1 hypothetical protein [Kitasatospora sp. MAA4]